MEPRALYGVDVWDEEVIGKCTYRGQRLMSRNDDGRAYHPGIIREDTASVDLEHDREGELVIAIFCLLGTCHEVVVEELGGLDRVHWVDKVGGEARNEGGVLVAVVHCCLWMVDEVGVMKKSLGKETCFTSCLK